jgi:hypothetical protein
MNVELEKPMLLDKILSVTNAELDAIDMSFYRNKYTDF